MTDQRLRELFDERVADVTDVDLVDAAWQRAHAVRRRRAVVAVVAAVVAIVGTTAVVVGTNDGEPPPAGSVEVDDFVTGRWTSIPTEHEETFGVHWSEDGSLIYVPRPGTGPIADLYSPTGERRGHALDEDDNFSLRDEGDGHGPVVRSVREDGARGMVLGGPVEAPDGEASGVYRVSDIRGWKPGKESYVASFAAVDGSVEGGSGG